MRKKICTSIAIIVTCCISLTGCIDHMPDMTQQQQSLVAEYAADLLLKYSKNYSSGLSETEAETEIETVTEEETTEESTTSEAEDESHVSGTTSKQNDESAEEPLEQVTLSEALGLDQFTITYDDYEIDDTYPDDENSYFSINVEKGKKILVMHFTVQNISEEEATCDIFSLSSKFYVKVNEQSYKPVMSTLLLDDLATYQTTIPAQGENKVVLLFEMKEEDTEDINSIDIRIQNDNQEYETVLF